MVRQDNNLIFDWFDDKINSFQNVVKPSEAFKKCNIPTNYANVLTYLHSCTNPLKNSITHIDHGILPDADSCSQIQNYLLTNNLKSLLIFQRMYLFV